MDHPSPRWQQIEEILHTALELPPEARGAFLDGACEGDPGLRREVEELLAAEAGAPAFLEEGAAEYAAALAATRRRAYMENHSSFLLAEHLRAEGRLAALTGDRAGAVRALRHYLALHGRPEPALEGEVARARQALRRLAGPGR